MSPAVSLAPVRPVPLSCALLVQSCCHSLAAQLPVPPCDTLCPRAECPSREDGGESKAEPTQRPSPGVPLPPASLCPFVPVPLAPVVCEQVTEVSWQRREEGRDVEAARGGAGPGATGYCITRSRWPRRSACIPVRCGGTWGLRPLLAQGEPEPSRALPGGDV